MDDDYRMNASEEEEDNKTQPRTVAQEDDDPHNDSNSNHHLETTAEQNASQSPQPAPPKYRVLQKVYARDKDGVFYVAVIRRLLFGPQYHQQVSMGFVTSKEEMEQQMMQQQTDNESSSSSSMLWHYFVHYNQWNVKFDRWVAEYDLYEITEPMTVYVNKVATEHRALLTQMRKPGTKGKKSFQTVNGAVFLRAWKQRLEETLDINDFLKPTTTSSGEGGDELKDKKRPSEEITAAVGKKSNKVTTSRQRPRGANKLLWTATTLEQEVRLRQQGLTGKQCVSSNTTKKISIVIPFTLKKVIVQQWELINQCNMVSCLPASVTVRQALDQYLATKHVVRGAVTTAANDNDTNNNNTANVVLPRDDDDSLMRSDDKSTKGQDVTVDDTTITLASGDIKPEPDPEKLSKNHPNDETTMTLAAAASETSTDVGVQQQQRETEWNDMANGIAMLFDEALPTCLLYSHNEIPQRHVIDGLYPETPYSEIYGTEHLLRLFVRLPDMLLSSSDSSVPPALEESEIRPMIAKVNDFIRFVHKNHGTLLTQTHRKMNADELKEQSRWFKKMGEGKKRLLVNTATTTTSTTTTTAPPAYPPSSNKKMRRQQQQSTVGSS